MTLDMPISAQYGHYFPLPHPGGLLRPGCWSDST